MSPAALQILQPSTAHLADEANHRIANHLTMLAGLLRLQAKGFGRMDTALSGDDVQRLLAEFAARLDTVGQVHRLLGHGSRGALDMAQYLETIARGLVSSLTADEQTTIDCVFPVTCVLPAEKAVALGLVIGELITNAVKYAHPAGVAGAIRVEASAPDEDTIAIEVCDDGVGLPDHIDPIQSQSLGFRMIRLLVKQLGASISFDNYGLGLSCTLQIPGTARSLRVVS